MTFNPDEAKRLADEMGEDDERAIDGQWSVDHGPDADVLLDGNGFAVCSIEHDANSTAAIARLRNNARSAATQLRAACEEVERLKGRVLKPLTEGEIKRALHEGRAEVMAATGDNAWTTLLLDRDRLAAECEAIKRRAQTEHDLMLARLEKVDDDNQWLREHCDVMAREAVELRDLRTTQTASIHALTEDLAKYRAIVEEMRPVYEAAVEWNRSDKAMEHGDDPCEGEKFRLAWDALNAAVDTALAAPKEKP